MAVEYVVKSWTLSETQRKTFDNILKAVDYARGRTYVPGMLGVKLFTIVDEIQVDVIDVE